MEIKAKTGVANKPMGIIVYSLSGLGKTTLLSDYVKTAKNGILFEVGESSLSDLSPAWASEIPHYENVLGDYYETTKDDSDWSDLQKAAEGYRWFRDEFLKFLMVGKHDFTNIAFDNFDNLLNYNLDAFVTLNYYGGNVGKANGYGGAKLVEMYSEAALIIKCFEYLQKKGISIMLSFHSQAITCRDPNEQDYRKHTIAVQSNEKAKIRELFINWSSATLFGSMDIEVENKKASGNRRILYTKISPSYDAKCRYTLPDTIDFSWDALKKAILSQIEKEKK